MESLPGSPGYRTRPGRSGYDPIDSRTEGANLVGRFVQRFFTVRVQIQNRVYLSLLAVIGLLLLIPLLFALIEAAKGTGIPLNGWSGIAVISIVGIFALLNFFKNLLRKRE